MHDIALLESVPNRELNDTFPSSLCNIPGKLYFPPEVLTDFHLDSYIERGIHVVSDVTAGINMCIS